MTKITIPGRGAVRCWGLAAAAILLLSAGTSQRAEALSLVNPGATPAAKHASAPLITEVRGGGRGGGGGGKMSGGGMAARGAGFSGGAVHAGSFRSGGPIHAGSFRSSGVAFRGASIRSGHVFSGGFRGSRFAFRHHRFHRGFFYGPSYYYDYYPRRCRIIWTYYGPRRICHHRWYHHHWRHRWHRHHYRYY
jgi:hypothetical protein